MLDGYRQNLRSSVTASAVSYGYTLTIWSSGALAVSVRGAPNVVDLLLFMAGGVAAFVLVEGLAFGALRVRIETSEPPRISVLGNAHLFSSGLAIIAVWAALHVVMGVLDWPVAGFLATSVYLLVNAVQITLAGRVAKSEE